MKYKLHCLFANREDLVRQAIEQTRDIGNVHLWPNNGAVDPGIPDTTVHILPPIAPVSAINLAIQSSWDDDVMFWVHNDAFVKPGIAAAFLEHVRNLHQISDRKWGACFTLYDVLCAFNMEAVRKVGYWDPMFFQYTSDVDYYRLLDVAGYPAIESGLGDGVIHLGSEADAPEAFPVPEGAPPHERMRLEALSKRGGSGTVRADSLFHRRIQFREQTGFDKAYYEFKWGGPHGREKYERPFNT